MNNKLADMVTSDLNQSLQRQVELQVALREIRRLVQDDIECGLGGQYSMEIVEIVNEVLGDPAGEGE